MKKILKLLSLIIASIVLTNSCEKKDDDLKGTNSFEIIKPIEIEENNERTKIVYENDLVVKICIEKENALPENPSISMFYETEFVKDTFRFGYENKKLSNICRIRQETSFNRLIERLEEQILIEYYSDDMIKSISFSYPLPGKKILIYDSKSRISKIEYEYENITLSSPPILLYYNDKDNLSSYCFYSDSKCSDASLYDSH